MPPKAQKTAPAGRLIGYARVLRRGPGHLPAARRTARGELRPRARRACLAAAHESARAYCSRAKSANTRAAYRSAVRAWCDRHEVPALPAASREVAAFLAAGRDRGQAGNTLRLRAAAIRFLHRAAGLPSPTDSAAVSETMAGIRCGDLARTTRATNGL